MIVTVTNDDGKPIFIGTVSKGNDFLKIEYDNWDKPARLRCEVTQVIAEVENKD